MNIGCIVGRGADRVREQADKIYDDEFLASLYDCLNPWSRSEDFYFGMATEIGGRVLDLGCGTGMLACGIAVQGLNVTGVDSAEGMLRVARSRREAELVAWIKADARTLHLNQRFDFIYMTGHAFQAMRSDDDALALLRTASEHLTSGGCFVFESRNPAQRAWLDWNREKSQIVETAEHGRIEASYEAALIPDTDVVELTHGFRLLDKGTTIVAQTQLRFIDQDHLEQLISAANLSIMAWYGDWNRTPLRADSREFVVVTRRSG